MKKIAKMLVFLWLFIFLGFFTQVSAQTSPNIGILVIAHGSPNKDWNRYVEWAVEDMETPFPVEIGFLEFTHPNISEAVSSLEEQNIEKIIAMPLFISSQSGHIEEIKYILGLRPDNPSEEPLEPVSTVLPIELTRAIDDHPFAVKVLADRVWALEEFLQRGDLSISDTNLVLIGHGDEEFIDAWQSMFTSLSQKVGDYLLTKYNLPFKSLSYEFLDSLKEIKNYCIENYCENNETFVGIPFFLAPGFLTNQLVPGYADEIKEHIHGIKIFYIEDPLLPSKYVSKIIETRIAETITPDIVIYENGQLKEINTIENSIEDNEKICLCALFAYKAFQLALNQAGDYHPQKEDLEVFTEQTTHGTREAFEKLAATVSQGSQDPRYLNADNYYYEIKDYHLRKKITLWVKPQIFPQGFFDLRTKVKTGEATSEEIKQFQQLRSSLQYQLLWAWDLESLFNFEISDI